MTSQNLYDVIKIIWRHKIYMMSQNLYNVTKTCMMSESLYDVTKFKYFSAFFILAVRNNIFVQEQPFEDTILATHFYVLLNYKNV